MRDGFVKKVISGLLSLMLIFSSGCATTNMQTSENQNESTNSKSVEEVNPLLWVLGFALGWSVGESLGGDD